MKLKIVLGLIILFILNGCKKEDQTQFTKDKDLYDLLTERSPTGTLDGLILPKGQNIPQIPQDPKNPLNEAKIQLGKLLFHETGLAINAQNVISMNTYSCASCHHQGAGFASGLKQGIGDGGEGYGIGGEGRNRNKNCPTTKTDVQPIKSPSVLNTAYQELMLWNGQFGATSQNIGTESRWAPGTPIANNNLGYEGLETQAIAGFDVHRLGINPTLFLKLEYRTLFKQAFPNITEDKLFTTQNIGLAIAAYERSLLANQSPYQYWLNGDESALTDQQKKGMNLFFDKANCYQCHNGPSLSSMEFYALGMDNLEGSSIIPAGGAAGAALGRGGFTNNATDNYKFKVPQLYNLSDARFFGHGASFTSIKEIIEYKNEAKKSNSDVPDSQLASYFKPLNLTAQEIEALTDFIENGLYDPNLERYLPNALPSGNCFPNNDSLSKQQLCN